MEKKKGIMPIILLLLWLVPTIVLSKTFKVKVDDQTPTAPLANPSPTSFQPRYISGFGGDNTFTVFFEDRDAGNTISYAVTTTGPNGFPVSTTPTNISDTHFCVKDWPINIGGTDYAYRAWGSVGNNTSHHFYVSNDLTNWVLVSTFTIPNDPAFTDAHGFVYYGFHDVIEINGTYYAFAETNQSQTVLVRSVNGDDNWEAFASIGGRPGWGPLELPAGVSAGWTPSGNFFDLGHDRGMGKIYVDPRDNNFYLAINTSAKASLSDADLEAAFIDPDNWTWNDETTGPASSPILSATAEHDLRECWLVPNSDPDGDWTLMYDADFGSADGGKALGYAIMKLPPTEVWVDDDWNSQADVDTYDPNLIWQYNAFNNIQDGIDAVYSSTIHVLAGTYNENILIDRHVQIIGAGSSGDPSSNSIITQSAAGAGDTKIGVVQLAASGVSSSDPILIKNFRIKPDGLAGISVGRFTESTNTRISYVKLENVKVIGNNTNPSTEQERGLYVDKTSSLKYMDVLDCSFDSLTYGWYLHKDVSSDTSTVSDVLVENTSFTHNNLKGIYVEKLRKATFTNCTFSENGFSSSGVPSYFLPWMAGVDINLKAGTYSNLTFEDCDITNNALGGAKEGVGLTVKGRGTGSDPSYAAYPAIVDNIRITGCNVTNNERGLRFGEPGKNNTGPTNVEVRDCNITGNVKTYSGSDGSAYGGLVNQSTATVNAQCNWWGDISGPGGDGPGTGDAIAKVSGNIVYGPWLDGAYPGGTCDQCGGPTVTNLNTSELFCDIQEAIDDVDTQNGDTLLLSAGTFTPAATINVYKSLTIRGPQTNVDPRPSQGSTRTAGSTEEAIVDGQGVLSRIFYLDADSIVLNGIEIKSGTGDMVRQSNSYTGTTVQYCLIHDGLGDEGVQLKECTNGKIQFNYVFDIGWAGDGLNFADSKQCLIGDNEITNVNSDNAAIYIYGSDSMRVENNLIYNLVVGEGIKLGNKNGADAARFGGWILNNTIHTFDASNTDDAICIYTSHVVVEGNDCYNNHSENGTIYLAYAIQDITIRYNEIHDNTLSTNKRTTSAGILLESRVFAETVYIHNNNIYSNTPYGLTNEAAAAAEAQYNYWGETDDSGPYHDIDNPDGNGDKISGVAEFCPWLDGSYPGGNPVTTDCASSDGDSDGIPDNQENGDDIDGDGIPNYLDDDSDGDYILDATEGTGDRDSDGIVNCYDYDPSGYIYNAFDGSLVHGGTISVIPPSGGTAYIDRDGSDGYYQFRTDGTAGTYVISYTPPSGYILSGSCPAQTTVLDPSPSDPDPFIVGLGSKDGTNDWLINYTCSDNPYYFQIQLEDNDPIVIQNNFPLEVSGPGPTVITLTAFEATVLDKGVKIFWQTETEPNNAGFNLYRSQTEEDGYVKINESLIPAQGNATTGGSYEVTDIPEQSGNYYYKLEDVSVSGVSTFHGPIVANGVTSVMDREKVIPDEYSLSQNYPNPFNPETSIEYGLPEAAQVTINIYDINGHLVRSLLSEQQTAGNHSVKWDGRNNNGAKVVSGVYFYYFKAKGNQQDFSQTLKMILMK